MSQFLTTSWKNKNLNKARKFNHILKLRLVLNNSLQSKFLIDKVSNLNRKTEFLNKLKTKKKGPIYEFFLKSITLNQHYGLIAQW